jgi:LPXTG-motif cell wall-anchored protein
VGLDSINRAVAAAGAVLAGVAASLLLAAPASAHARLLRTTPAADSTVYEPFAEIRLTFNQPVRQSATSVTVAGADGTSYGDGAARSVDADVVQAVRGVPAGPVRETAAEASTWVPWAAGAAAVVLLAGGGLLIRRRRHET